jgi:hypothetical protein
MPMITSPDTGPGRLKKNLSLSPRSGVHRSGSHAKS